MQHNQNLEERFSDDHEENLRIENDILKLKLHASYGSDVKMGGSEGLPPEIENMFLKNVFAFEEAMQNEELMKIYEHLGKPVFKASEEIDEENISVELARILSLLEEHGIQLDVLGTYEDRTIYKFVTEELFEHEVLMSPKLPGFTLHFIYEEFHPNHTYDIENRVQEFFTDWFERKFDEYSFELANSMLIADGQVMKKEELLQKLQLVFESYTAFTDKEYSIRDIKFQINDEDSTGMGYAEGDVKYYATLEDGKQILIGGPFKFYMSYDNNWWQIFYFVFPGFEW